MQSAVFFNFFEFRTGIWIPKAYFVGLDAGGRPRVVHQTAQPELLATYDIPADPPLLRALELAAGLRDRTIAERFRKGSKSRPTLAGLVAPTARERKDVLLYIHTRSAELLELCQRHGYGVTVNLDTRASPHAYTVALDPAPWVPVLDFALTAEGLEYRLRLQSPHDGAAHLVRHLDPRIVTNRPAPGWVLTDHRLLRVAGMAGNGLKPFLTRDAVHIPPPEVGKYLREFVARAARKHPLTVTGMEYAEVTQPTGLRLTAAPHPFAGHYLLQLSVGYGDYWFALGDPETTAVDFRDRPPYRIHRILRDSDAEAERLPPLYARGLEEVGERRALTVRPAPGAYENLAWLLAHEEELTESGIEVIVPEEEGHSFSRGRGQLSLNSRAGGDWLDLNGTVEADGHAIPFTRLVKNLQRGERKFLLPDGRWFLIPEEWFTRYAPGLAFARVEGSAVRLARSHAPLLTAMGLATEAAQPETAVADFQPPAGLRATLRPYQLEGVRWLARHHDERLGACLADDMGLGKTLQTIATLLYAKERIGTDSAAAAPAPPLDLFSAPAEDEEFLRPLRALIVLPASLVYNWRSELGRFAPGLTVLSHVGSKRSRDARVLRRYDVLLTTYQTAQRDVEVLRDLDLEYIVLDESQQIKNRKSKVFRALNSLEARHRISLSGTPIENSLSDLWSQMQFINPGLLRSFAFFRREFIQPIEQHDDEAKKRQLRELVAPYLLRRTKAEVAPDLPDLETQVFYCEMTSAQASYYERERAAARNALLGIRGEDDNGGGDYKLRVIQALTRLRQLANHPGIVDAGYGKGSGKFEEVSNQLETIRRAGRKVLVFSSMVSHLELYREPLREAGQPYAWITGDVPADRRAEEVRRFQEDPAVQTFFISIRAGGTGLNLTGADYVFLLDPWWNPTVEEQAIARAHRIGRQGKVFARKFLTKGTLEEKIFQLQQRKKRLATEIIDGGAGLDLDPGEIDYLLG
ncbi:non-specific serine/threonine protein kinase [Lewinella marina]|uniref:Helicase SNF2 n=1 Tax=Neolewinella marina TaxID=438751 RepID=A0A2G0CJE2_9BACT|nr:DEAD/DEAH box helicase [Neolewinella marina]NJB84802.1 non-specific serine/threonine protein kinase [Neolewinella marina]PHL00041.1 helicase SNF2 [Neolewinella marina]